MKIAHWRADKAMRDLIPLLGLLDELTGRDDVILRGRSNRHIIDAAVGIYEVAIRWQQFEMPALVIVHGDEGIARRERGDPILVREFAVAYGIVRRRADGVIEFDLNGRV